MRLSVPGVRIADVETCDFGLMPSYDTASLLRLACPDTWERYLESPLSRRLIAELGVERRHLTHVPGQVPDPARRTAMDLARSAVERLRVRRPEMLTRLDALIFVSTSNPNPCNCQAALLAEQLGLTASCFDLKSGCSGGVLGLAQAALLVAAGCERVLVVIAENLSQLTPPDDLRALLSVGDGAACVLVEKHEGPGSSASSMTPHPSSPAHLWCGRRFHPRGATRVTSTSSPIPPAVRDFVHERWRVVFHGSLEAAAIAARDLVHCCFHQTHGAQIDALVRDLGLEPTRVVRVVHDHGNMGSPTFAVAMAQAFAGIAPGQRYLMQAVGGGLSSCAIVAEHQ